MTVLTIIATLTLLTLVGYALGRRRALGVNWAKANSLPVHHGALVAIWCAVPCLVILLAWVLTENQVVHSIMSEELSRVEPQLGATTHKLRLAELDRLARSDLDSSSIDSASRVLVVHQREVLRRGRGLIWLVLVALSLVAAATTLRRLHPQLKARDEVERFVRIGLATCSLLAIVVTVGIVLSVLFEAIRFFEQVPIGDFLLGTVWSPQTAIRGDQVGSTGAFGAIPLFAGTVMIALVAMLIAIPVGLMAAIYLAEYAHTKVRTFAKPVLEVLAGIPTVVYGYFAAVTVAPALHHGGHWMGVAVSSESALAAGLVMGIMIIPFVSSLSEDVINAVPAAMRDGSLALGATQSETIRKVILPAALPGIVGSILLAMSRAIGETMIVVMAAGLAAKLTANPLESVTTVTAQIVTLLVGDQEFDSPKTLAAFALGLTLFVATLILNVVALKVVRRYREQYD